MRTLLATAPTLWREPLTAEQLALAVRDLDVTEVVTFGRDPIGRSVARWRGVPLRNLATWSAAIEHADAVVTIDDARAMVLAELVSAAKARGLVLNDYRLE